MSGPVYTTIGGRNTATAVTTLTPTKAVVTGGTGGILLAFLSTLNNDNHTCATSGWTKVRQDNSGAGRTASLWIAAQTAAAPVFSWATASDAVAATIYYTDDETNPLDSTAVGAIALGTGTASPLAVASITSTRLNSRFVYIAIEGNTALATPAGYTEHYDVTAALGGGTATGSKVSTAVGTVAGAISVAAATPANVTSYVMWHVELMREAGPSPSLQASRMETGAWLDNQSEFAGSRMETGAWLEPAVSEFAATRVEVGAWVEGTGVTARRRQAAVVN